MTPLWTERCIELREWVTGHPRLLVGCDFDGTLAPLVQHADHAVMPDPTRAALAHLAELPGVLVAVISGRSLADTRARVGLPGLMYAGNHGLEMLGLDGEVVLAPGSEDFQGAVAQVVAELIEKLAGIEGAWIEDKQATASVHYRQVAEKQHELVEAAVKNAVGKFPGLVVKAGKKIWEIRPGMRWHKGSALTWFMHQHDCPPGCAAFLGDDLSDYDAFESLAGGWSFFVGQEAPSIASARLEDAHDTLKLLEWMVRVRKGAAHLSPAGAE